MDFSPYPVLVVDDKFESKSMCDLLRSVGFRHFFRAQTRDAALGIIAGEYLGLGIISLKLPDCDGLHLITHVRRSYRDPQRRLPLLALSAACDSKTVLSARNAGANHVLAKPYGIGHLVNSAKLALRDPRDFITGPGYVGPDRRRYIDGTYRGSDRRVSERDVETSALVSS